MQSAKNASPQDAVETLKEILAKFTPGAPIAHEHLVMVPLYDNAAESPRDYLTLSEALEAGTASLREVSGGSVPEVLFDNKGGKPVLLVEGDELSGAMQNRTINITVFAPAKQETIIPVSCVEGGRWRYITAAGFHSDDEGYHFSRGRRGKIDALNKNLRERGSRQADQGEVWDTISEKFGHMEMSSQTSDASEFRQRSRPKLSDYKSAVQAQPKQVGGVFFAGNDIGGVDLFAHGDVFAHMFPKLLTSYALDAIDAVKRSGEVGANAGQQSVDELLAAVRAAPGEVYEATGLGNDVRIDSEQITGGALLHDKRVLHLAAFRRDEVGGGRNVNHRAKARAQNNRG